MVAPQVYSSCNGPQSQRLGGIWVTCFAASAINGPNGWELRAGFFTEPHAKQGVFIFNESHFAQESDKASISLFGVRDTTNYTNCMPPLPIWFKIICNVGHQYELAEIYRVIPNGLLIARCKRPGSFHAEDAQATALMFTDLDGNDAYLRVPLCLSQRKWVQVSSCSQPLYDRESMEREHPTLMHDWIVYHRALGVNHMTLYDIDGSLSSIAAEYDFVDYRGFFADALGNSAHGFEHFSKQYPLCAQHVAYQHCLITHFGLSNWVLLLHAPDEYVHVLKSPAGYLHDFIPMSLEAYLTESNLSRRYLSEVHLQMFSFQATAPRFGIGSVVHSSVLRAADADMFRGVPALNPNVCLQTDGHRCLGGVTADGEYMLQESRKLGSHDLLKINHYTEMLARDVGRCAFIGPSRCDVLDTGLLWVPAWLELSKRNPHMLWSWSTEGLIMVEVV